jgi:hypothetical protein
MLLDQFVPNPHFVARYSVDVDATADEAYRALWTADFGSSLLIRGLMYLRHLPSRLFRGKPTVEVPRLCTLRTMTEKVFGLLAEDPGREVVLGLVGRFWHPIDNVELFRPEYFTGPLPRGLAKAVFRFAVEDGSAAGKPVRIVTETRVVCADAASRLKFGLYWALVGPFSGLTRKVMLRAIQRACKQLRASSQVERCGAA